MLRLTLSGAQDPASHGETIWTPDAIPGQDMRLTGISRLLCLSAAPANAPPPPKYSDRQFASAEERNTQQEP